MQNELGKKDGENTINFCIGKKYTTEVMVCEESVSFDKLAFSICSFLNLLLCCILKRKKKEECIFLFLISTLHIFIHICVNTWIIGVFLTCSLSVLACRSVFGISYKGELP